MLNFSVSISMHGVVKTLGRKLPKTASIRVGLCYDGVYNKKVI